MVNVKTAAIAAILACALGLIGFRFWPGDERAIRKQLALIEQAGSKEPTEQPIQSLVKGRQLAELFHDPCRLEGEAVDYAGDYSRKQIMDHIAIACTTWSSTFPINQLPWSVAPSACRAKARANLWPMCRKFAPICARSRAPGCSPASG